MKNTNCIMVKEQLQNLSIAGYDILQFSRKQMSSLASSIGRAFDSYSREAIKRLRVRPPRRATTSIFLFFLISVKGSLQYILLN